MPDVQSDFYIVIHVWTTSDEHGVCVAKDSAEVIEIAWILVNAKTLEEVSVSTAATRSSIFSYFWKFMLTASRCAAKRS